jgi:hypothetical protein
VTTVVLAAPPAPPQAAREDLVHGVETHDEHRRPGERDQERLEQAICEVGQQQDRCVEQQVGDTFAMRLTRHTAGREDTSPERVKAYSKAPPEDTPAARARPDRPQARRSRPRNSSSVLVLAM